MRTTVTIDDRLLHRARGLARTSSPSRLVNLGLGALLREDARRKLLDWIESGSMEWDLSDLRTSRHRRGRARSR